MNITQIIEKKRDKLPLDPAEIKFFVRSVCNESVPDYQISALLMAICINGMNDEETSLLTEAMAKSGDTVDLSFIDGIKVDKHSSGGVGDKVTLAVAPMASACGLSVAKMSGRGLGFSGGTVDKLESIPGFRTTLTEDEFITFVKRDKIAVMGQTKNVAPADKKLYAIRDVTGTVPSIPLIASSIMSKKLACGSDAIVLDVKCGSGAFMKTFEEAAALAEAMEAIGRNNGRNVTALITKMDQPIGKAVGNALEVREAAETLKGSGPSDFTELCMIIGSFMLVSGKIAANLPQARQMLENAVNSGSALAKFKKLIENQGGDPAVADNTDLLPKANTVSILRSPCSGFISEINGEKAGNAALTVKAGRLIKTDTIDYSSGFVFLAKAGDSVAKGQPLAEIHVANENLAREAETQLLQAFTFGEKPEPEPEPILLAYIDKEGIHYDKDRH